jgi:hypothetical protein
MKNIKLLILLLAFVPVPLLAQIPTYPNPYSFNHYDNTVNTNPSSPRTPAHVNQNRSQNYNNTYEQDRLEVQRRNEEIYRILNENREISYDLPSLENIAGTEYYRRAAEALIKMLQGKTPPNLRDAVFTVENAYFEGKLDKSKYNKSIDDLIYLARHKTAEDKYNWNNNMVKNIMLFRIMADTLKIKLPLHEKNTISYPMQYDFDDPWGRDDVSKQFISKLLTTHSGQCHSLPLLYLILCEAAGAEAYMAYSPSHSYVKIKDNTGDWYNIELTNGRFTTDAFVVGSGFVTAESIKSGIYLEPQSKYQTVANCFADLLGGYTRKYGYDEFVNRCVDTILKYDNKNLRAMMLKSNYKTFCIQYVANQIGNQSVETVRQRYPKIFEMVEDCKKWYQQIDALGYKDIPEEVYKEWLQSLNREKKRREEHEQKYKQVIQLLN